MICQQFYITPSDLPDEIYKEDFEFLEKTDKENFNLYEIEKEYIAEAFNKCSGNKSKAARMLGISRVTLMNKLKRYKIV